MTESPEKNHSGHADGAIWRAMPRRNTQKVSHLLAADLRRQILSGQLSADQQLPPEPELTAQLRISRETLREALRILESQQLVEIKRGRGGGAMVRRPGLDGVSRYVALLLQLRRTTLAHLEEARSVIEPAAAEQVAMRAGYEDLDTLVALHDAERAAETDPLAFVTAMTAFEQAVTELSGNQTLSVIAGVFRDIYAGQVYSAIGSDDAVSAERIARRVVVSHSAFLDAARRRDMSLAQKTWGDYLFTTSRLLVSRNVSRQPIDMTPLWRAQAGQEGAEPTPRRAMLVATEIRSRIAEGRLSEGSRLPPLAELAEEFGISRPTLREALRILEMEFLLDLRTGDRGGATIRTPSSRVAAQLAGIVLEARGTTLSDFYRAMRLIEPPMIGLVAARVSPKQLRSLEDMDIELAAAIDDTPRFVVTLRNAEQLAFSAVKNPALTVIAELMHWVRVGVEPAVTANAKAIPSVSKSNRNFQELFSQFVSAAGVRDSGQATEVWARALGPTAPWIEESELGERLMLDLMD
ncbi:GntR family transcriptional regulator [Mycobacterium sp. CVI_P3]|uniref:GntR family transcriptional regulator n=1 Tax=Mycobacterium pinniadriaticum TaxID=2994102 RepID=A0ABT3SP56_9MYCO|nr:GntR family transcriptional regulator [Mycobacterium pinniadriaticum]MCX2934884.1 GntR family transcriptional regulator [Mycobacterium pinniadriaticum]MCX2941306.1 GntR family transcriptional regulator [Mycobacterium pinniadriaticum]